MKLKKYSRRAVPDDQGSYNTTYAGKATVQTTTHGSQLKTSCTHKMQSRSFTNTILKLYTLYPPPFIVWPRPSNLLCSEFKARRGGNVTDSPIYSIFLPILLTFIRPLYHTLQLIYYNAQDSCHGHYKPAEHLSRVDISTLGDHVIHTS